MKFVREISTNDGIAYVLLTIHENKEIPTSVIHLNDEFFSCREFNGDKTLTSIRNRIILTIIIDNCLIVSAGRNWFSMTFLPLSMEVNSELWWRSSYCLGKNSQKVKECGNTTIIVPDNDGSRLVGCVLDFLYPYGEKYDSFNQARHLLHLLGYDRVMTNLPVIPVISDPVNWGMKIITPFGRILFNSGDGRERENIGYSWIEERSFRFPDCLMMLSEKDKEEINQKRNAWVDNSGVHVVIDRNKKSNGRTMAESLRQLLNIFHQDNLFRYEPGSRSEIEELSGNVPDKLFVPRPKMKEFSRDYSLPANVGKGVL